MNNFRKIAQVTGICLGIVIVSFYCLFLTVLPKIMNSPRVINKIEKKISDASGIDLKFKNFKFETKKDLTFTIFFEKVFASNPQKETLIDISDLKYKAPILNYKRGEIDSKNIYANIHLLKNYIKLADKKNKKINLSFYPTINIQSGVIVLTPKTSALIKHIKSKKQNGKIKTEILACIKNPYLKNIAIIGEKGSINFKNKLSFDNFSVKIGHSKIFLSGKTDNLSIKGNNLPAKELEEGFLYLYKLKHPDKKNFLENFSNFKGTLDVDLKIAKGKFYGTCTTNNLSANFSTLKIPVLLPKTVYYFKDKTMKAKTEGLFGPEPVTTDVIINGIATKDLDVKGNVESKFTNNIVKKYYPNVAISGYTPAKVKYHTHDDGIVDVYYYLTIPKGNNLLSTWGDLDNTGQTREITMHTHKNGIPMVIKRLSYKADNKDILSGSGLIDKENGTYTLKKLNIKSNGEVPIAYIKSFIKDFADKGTFDTDVNIDFTNKTILGTMNLYNASHDKFLFLKSTNLNFEKDKITLKTNGTFYKAPIKLAATTDNRILDNKITVKNIDIHLVSIFLQSGELKSIPKTFKKGGNVKPKISKKKTELIIEQGRIIVDRIYGNKFDVRNVNIQGGMRNKIVNFIMPKAEYAKGLLSAKGIYNLNNDSSDIQFFASDIDSNDVATHMFKLPNQIEGLAYATLHLITKNKLNYINAKATFAVKDGSLTKIGTREFSIKRKNKNKPAKKYVLSKITNIDFSKPDSFHSNLYGSFDMINEKLENIKIFSKSNYLGLYIEGEYNVETEYGEIDIFGQRNKTLAKKIRIFKIPLNLIYKVVFKPEHSIIMYEDKVKMIPEIKAGIGDEISTFRVSIQGNPNKSDKLKVTLKDLRK